MHSNKFLTAAFCSLLAFAALLAGSQQAPSQTPAAAQGAQASAPSVSSERLVGQTVSLVLDGTAPRVSHYAPEQKLRLALAVQPPHMAEEEQFIKELTTKGSPNFHQFLSPADWNARFAPSAADEQAIVDWAQSQGLTVTHRYANRLLVDVEAPAGVIEQAFGVTINNYQVGTEVDFANDRDPLIPTSLSGTLHAVLGLNSIERFHRMGTAMSTQKGPDYVAGPAVAAAPSMHGDGDVSKAPANRNATMISDPTSPTAPTPMMSGGVADPSNITSSQAYDYDGLARLSHCCNVNGDPQSPDVSSIALVGYGNFQASDVEAFFNNYGMAYNFSSYYINGTGFPGQDDEAPLDVEYSGAMANSFGAWQNTAAIYEYEMPNNLYATYADAFNQIASDDHAKVVSTSYGWEEGGFSSAQATGTMHPIFNSMVGAGWTLIASAGDNGSSDGCDSHLAVDYPASDPDFIAAGGTQLLLDASGNYVSEIAWVGENWSGACGSNHGGGGGGLSSFFAAPYWQSSLGYTTKRAMPDFSLTANPDVMGEWYYYNGGWLDEGGTSIVAPELAGFFAQENSYLNYIGHKCGAAGTSACTPVGLASPFIYENGNGSTQHYPFYDITSGCTGNDDTVAWGLTPYCATTGFDLATGWGSANMMQLAWGINWQLIPAYGNPSIAFSGPATSTWYNTNQQVNWTLSDAGSSGFPAPGVAGFTQGWDSIPADPYSEPHGGSGNSFYAGPQFPFASTGCLAFSNNGCSGNGGAQGCHTVHVRGWDNQGVTTGDQTYGPLCYDSVAPTIAINTNVAPDSGNWFNIATGNPFVSLVATDPGGGNASGVHVIYGVVGATSCAPANLGTCQIYGPTFQLPEGANPITAFSLDNAGNFSSVAYTTLWVDTVAPVTTNSNVGQWNNGVSSTAVQVNLNATDATSGVEYTYYTLDGGANTNYYSPFMVSTAGSHTLHYWSVDWASNTETQHTATFAIKSPTTSVLVAAPNPSMLGQSVTLTATVAATLTGTPTGTVTFWNGATNLGTSALSGGVASITTSALPAGQLTLQASYNGATYFTASNSVPFDQTVNENTTTTVSISPNPLVYGQFVTVTATVTPATSGTPTGFVTIYLNGANVGNLLLSSGVGTASTPYFGSLTPGAYSITATYDGDSTYLTSTSPTFTEHLNPASQTITFPAIAAQYAATSVPLTATASSGLAVTYTSTTPTVCSVSGATASSLISGGCTIAATQAGNGNYLPAAAVYSSFWVNHAAQTITFPPVPSPEIALTGVVLSATASSGLTVSLTSTTPTVCSVAGTTASLLVSGTCTIHATQAGNAAYNPATSVNQSFTVAGIAQTITFPAIAVQYAATTVGLSATASSGLTVTYTSTTPTICSVSGATASSLIGGTCTIAAMQAGNSVYSAATAVYHSFYINLAHQTITFPAIATQTALTSLSLTATASSGLAVAYTSTTPTICTVSGASASLLIAGTCTLQANQAGNATYSPAPQVTRSFLVESAQTITFPTIATQTALTSVGLSATASSGLTVAFASTTPTVCTVAGTTASLLIAGTCTIHATQAGNGVYGPAPAVIQSFTVSHIAQTITFPAIAAQYALTSVGLTATGGASGNPVTYTSTTPTICSVSGATVSSLIGGTCTIAANQAGNSVYSAATAVYHSFFVNLAHQTITFPNPGPQTGVPSLNLSATASSGLTVAFASTTPTVCTVASGATTASLLVNGTCSIQATQAGTAAYNSAPAVNQSFTVTAP